MDLNIIITEVTYTLTILVVNTPDLILTPLLPHFFLPDHTTGLMTGASEVILDQ